MNFLDVLQKEFHRRRSANPRYSLRAFARNLRIDHSTLSQFLRGRRRMTPRAIRALGTRLGTDHQVVERCCAAANDAAVLGFVARSDFRADSRWIAVRLGLPLDEVNISVQRLLHQRTLAMPTRSRWVRAGV